MPKNILITGTSRGIGLELVKAFAEEDHRVLALSRNVQPVQALDFPAVKSFSFDITEKTSREKVGQFVAEEWEGIDIVIHNAGQLVNGNFPEIRIEDLERVYQTNVFGGFSLTQELLPYLHQHSRVVAVSSMGGIQGSVKSPGLTAYSSSKAAVINLMEVLAEEYKQTGPVFNALALGAVNTEMFREAVPEGKARLQPRAMAAYIKQFALTGNRVY